MNSKSFIKLFNITSLSLPFLSSIIHLIHVPSEYISQTYLKPELAILKEMKRKELEKALFL